MPNAPFHQKGDTPVSGRGRAQAQLIPPWGIASTTPLPGQGPQVPQAGAPVAAAGGPVLPPPPPSFAVELDVSQYKPEEVKVSIEGTVVRVAGALSAELPAGTVPDNVDASLDSGRLRIEAPAGEAASGQPVEIPVRRMDG